ncbi:MAG: SpoIID/LytB domain-containing protein [Phycisphaerae bacterium]
MHRKLRALKALWEPVFRPCAILAAACLLSAMILTSCARKEDAIAELAQPLAKPESPDLRVLLTNSPAPVAKIATTGGYRLRVGTRTLTASQGTSGDLVATHTGGRWSFNGLQAETGVAMLEPLGDSLVKLNGVAYRGSLRLIPAGPNSLRVVNVVDLERYLASVIAKELYSHWHLQAYRAQAVAARTFALYQQKTYGRTHDHDVRADQSSQAYPGLASETDKSWQAVESTAGVVLTYPVEGSLRLFRSQYSSCCGGHVNPAEVVQKSPDIPPLQGGQVCTDCGRGEFASAKYRWNPVTISKSDVYRSVVRRYPTRSRRIVNIHRIVTDRRAPHGRAISIKLYDTRGKAIRMLAEDLRVCLLQAGVPEAKKLYSMNCLILNAGDAFVFTEGHGFGHGIGMCQYGAQSKAAKGWTAEQILGFYYPGARLVAVR